MYVGQCCKFLISPEDLHENNDLIQKEESSKSVERCSVLQWGMMFCEVMHVCW